MLPARPLVIIVSLLFKSGCLTDAKCAFTLPYTTLARTACNDLVIAWHSTSNRKEIFQDDIVSSSGQPIRTVDRFYLPALTEQSRQKATANSGRRPIGNDVSEGREADEESVHLRDETSVKLLSLLPMSSRLCSVINYRLNVRVFHLIEGICQKTRTEAAISVSFEVYIKAEESLRCTDSTLKTWEEFTSSHQGFR